MINFKNILGRKIVVIFYYLFRIFPIQSKKIFVSNFFGKGYGDSPKYIIDYLINKYSDYDVVWSVIDDYEFPKGIRSVKKTGYWGLLKTIYEQVTSKVWIDNCRKHPFERKRNGQYYIQTWHGDIGNKKAGGDVLGISEEEISIGKHDSTMADLFVCGNEWMCSRYREAYWFDGEVAICGLPRRDILYHPNDDLINNIKGNLGISRSKKILLYVPTFRNEDIFEGHLGGYVSYFIWKDVLEALENRFGGEWIGLIRLHPNASKFKSELNLPKNVIDVTTYPDIMELLLVSDCCISDYSSALYDFSVSQKPGFIFAPDIDNYEIERGHYFSNEITPFTISSNIVELVHNIRQFDESLYKKRYNNFITNIIHLHPEGNASEYLCNRIIEVCNAK